MIVKEWKDSIATYHLKKLSSWVTAGFYYCGYCTLPFNKSTHDIEDKVYVHGGITFKQRNPDGTWTFGFDCAHYGDEHHPELQDENWLKEECENMARQLDVL